LLDQLQYIRVGQGASEVIEKELMIQRSEKVLDVGVDGPEEALGASYNEALDGHLDRTFGAKSKAAIKELPFEKRLDGIKHGALGDAVANGEDSDLALAAIGFQDADVSGWERFVGFVEEVAAEFLKVRRKISLESADADGIGAG
jgi:hypothetical protein